MSITGCKFIDCNFRKIKSNGTNIFKFSIFKDCQIQYSFMLNCLPKEPAISKDIVQNLENESYKLGLYDEYLQYKYKRIQINENCLKEDFLRRDEWHKGHCTKLESFIAGLHWLLSKCNGIIWGYGEKLINLMISFFVIIVGLFLFIFGNIFDTTNNSTFIDVVVFSLENIFSSGEKNIFISGQPCLDFVILLQKFLSIFIFSTFYITFYQKSFKEMKEDIALWLYGSTSRGDNDKFSDIDVLIIGKSTEDLKYARELISKDLSQINLNFYLWKEIKNMAKYGSLFLHHLRIEGKCMYEGKFVTDELLYLFSNLPEYKKANNDLKSFLKVIEETKQSLIFNEMLYFDMSVLATVIRHCSILGCWFLKNPCFNRIEPVRYLIKKLGFLKINIEEYSKLYKYKLYIDKRINGNELESIKVSPRMWLKNSEMIVKSVERIVNG